jgi:hypothetical protein
VGSQLLSKIDFERFSNQNQPITKLSVKKTVPRALQSISALSPPAKPAEGGINSAIGDAVHRISDSATDPFALLRLRNYSA